MDNLTCLCHDLFLNIIQMSENGVSKKTGFIQFLDQGTWYMQIFNDNDRTYRVKFIANNYGKLTGVLSFADYVVIDSLWVTLEVPMEYPS